MEQKKISTKDILLLLAAILMAIILYVGISTLGTYIAMGYYMIAKGANMIEASVYVLKGDAMMIVTAVMHVSFVVVFGIWYKFVFVKKNKIPFKRVFTVRNIVCFVVLGLSLQVAISYLLEIVGILLPSVMEKYLRLLETMDIGNSVLTLVVTVLLAPVGEELIFRGVIMGYAKRLMPFFVANFLQAVLFGVYHMNLVQGTYAFLMGLLLGYLVKKCDSLLASISVHFIINGSANLLTLLSSGESASTESVGIVTAIVISLIASIICGIACYFVQGKKAEEE